MQRPVWQGQTGHVNFTAGRYVETPPDFSGSAAACLAARDLGNPSNRRKRVKRFKPYVCRSAKTPKSRSTHSSSESPA